MQDTKLNGTKFNIFNRFFYSKMHKKCIQLTCQGEKYILQRLIQVEIDSKQRELYFYNLVPRRKIAQCKQENGANIHYKPKSKNRQKKLCIVAKYGKFANHICKSDFAVISKVILSSKSANFIIISKPLQFADQFITICTKASLIFNPRICEFKKYRTNNRLSTAYTYMIGYNSALFCTFYQIKNKFQN